MRKTKKIWLNGKFLDWEKAKVHILTHGLHYGSGVFEGIRAYQTSHGLAIFRLKEHLERFFYSAKILKMPIPYSKSKIKQAILKLIKLNEVKDCYIRPIAFFGYGKMGLLPKGAPVNLALALWPWEAYLGQKPIKVKISRYIRLHPQSAEIKAKLCGYYVNSILASLEAEKAGCQEALLLDHKGFISEGPGENIFIVKRRSLFTPPPQTILPGITRDTIMKIARDLNLKVYEKNIKPSELKKVEEAFFCGTAVEICPIGKINNTWINKGEVGPITQKIKETFQKIVRGEIKKYRKWLTFVK